MRVLFNNDNGSNITILDVKYCHSDNFHVMLYRGENQERVTVTIKDGLFILGSLIYTHMVFFPK